MQNQDTNRIIPTVRYHPTIKLPEDAAQTKTRTSQTKKARSGGVGPPQARTVKKAASKSPQVNKDPPVRSCPPPKNPQVNEDRPVRSCLVPKSPQVNGDPPVRSHPAPQSPPKQGQRDASCRDPPPGAARPSDRGPFTPEQVPLGLNVELERDVVQEVEVLTRGQRTNPDWFSWRKNRITASVAHRIAHCGFVNGKSKTPPTSYLDNIIGEGRRIQTRAMSWGIQMEAEAVRRYQVLKSAALRRSVSVLDCGLFIDTQRSWLAASPDGIVTDSRTGQWLFCLEVKCPYKHRENRLEDACRNDRAFCLEIQEEEGRQPGRSPVYRLKRSHSYFTQIQCQLAMTGLQQADLVVYTLKETAIVPVTFDPDLWEETVSRLEKFYRDAVLPRLRERNQQEPGAAWTPEL